MKSKGMYDYLARQLAEQLGLPIKTGREAVAWVLAFIEAELRVRRKVFLPRFGTFKVATTKARAIRNPVTKEMMQLAPSRRVVFRAAKDLRNSVRRDS